MALTLPDASFLFALYGQDAHTAVAKAATAKLGVPLTLTMLQRYELANAVRFAAFRKVISGKDATTVLTAFEADLQAGYLVLSACDLETVVQEAQRLSAIHTVGGGHRSFDILHVAAAVVLGAGEFYSFDANQRKLAKAVGLAVGP
jgi:predicted nucleic acid-binding protein